MAISSLRTTMIPASNISLAKILFALPILFITIAASGQKEIKTYYDEAKSRVSEDYFVIDDNQTMEGKYRKYFPNGRLAIEGAFVNGVRSGTFYEYHENGTLIRKISYENGMRHGPVEVFDEKGRPIQIGR